MLRLGVRLNELRTSRGFTLEEVAKAINTTKQQVFRIEHGQVPNAETVSKLALFFTVSSDYLLGLVDEPHDRLKPADLSPDELKFLGAIRDKSFPEVLGLIAALMTEGANGGAA